MWFKIGPGNGLLSDGTKPLPEPMLTYHQRCSVAFTWEQFQKCSWTSSVTCVQILHFENYYHQISNIRHILIGTLIVRTYPMALMLWTEDVIFTPTLCRTPLFLTPCFMGLVGVTDITSSQSFITLRDNGSLLTNHASTPPMGKLLSCFKSFPPRAPPADPTALISWRGIALGFPKPQCRRSSPILVIFPAITLFWWPPHLAMAPSSGTILIWRHNQVVVMTQ